MFNNYLNKRNTDFILNPRSVKNNEYILYSHLGLGDQIILSGAINKLSSAGHKLHIVSYSKFKTSMDYLYRKNSNIQIFYLPDYLNSSLQDHPDIDVKVKEYGSLLNIEILKIGYENINKRLPFYEGLYKHLRLNYKISYNNFLLEPDDDLNIDLKNHLFKVNSIENEQFLLIHNEHSTGVKKLKNIPDKKIIYVSKKTDPMGNMFLYQKLIYEASQIHCINSSFIHLVDRLNTPAKLFYHDLIGSTLKLKNQWQIINY
jgi:hypothetical protein